MNSPISYIIVAAYLIAVAVLGVLSGGKQTSMKDYFLGSSKIPWWVICFSVVAAETSTLTFISIPGLAYLGNFNFLQVTFGYLIGRIIVARLFLPKYFSGELSTAYQFLENRFGRKTRSFASVVFIFTRLAADGVRLFATAIPIKLMLGVNYPTAIVIIGIVTLFYTTTGGIRGVIWVDALQMLIYFGAAIMAVFFLLSAIPGGFSTVNTVAMAQNKWDIINPGFQLGMAGFFKSPYTLIGGLIGGTFLSMASHGTDQLVVQRLLVNKDISSARKAVIGSGIIIIIQFALFLFVGLLLFVFNNGKLMRGDEVFPQYIVANMPPVATGIIIAGLLAAALSTLAGSVSSLSQSFIMDLFLPLFGKRSDEKELLKLSRVMTLLWGILLVFSAFLFMESPKVVVELALSIASFTFGGLLGTFLNGIFNTRAKQEDALAGFTAGIFVMIAVISSGLLGWTWFTLIGVCTSMLVTFLLSRLNSEEQSTK